METEVEFRIVDRSNWEQCTSLKVSKEQRDFVASNSFSLAQAAYEPDTYPFAIYFNGEMAGFIMYDYDSNIGVWEMCRLMVDERFQGRGIGRAAVKKLLGIVTEKLGHIMFYTSAEPSNSAALGLYEKMGFVRNGRIVYDEVMMEIQL